MLLDDHEISVPSCRREEREWVAELEVVVLETLDELHAVSPEHVFFKLSWVVPELRPIEYLLANHQDHLAQLFRHSPVFGFLRAVSPFDELSCEVFVRAVEPVFVSWFFS